MWGHCVADCGHARIGGGRGLLELVWVAFQPVRPTLMRCAGAWGLNDLWSLRVCMLVLPIALSLMCVAACVWGCLVCTLVMPTVIVVVLAVVVVWAGWSVTRVLLPVVVVVAGGSGLRRHPSKSRRNLGGFPHQV